MDHFLQNCPEYHKIMQMIGQDYIGSGSDTTLRHQAKIS